MLERCFEVKSRAATTVCKKIPSSRIEANRPSVSAVRACVALSVLAAAAACALRGRDADLGEGD
jgi:hypothetical protein